MLTNILRGKITKKIEELPHLKEIKEFECLANFSKSDVLDKIDRLIDDGMIEKYKIKNMPLLKITKAGYDYLSLK
jgi:RIO-like serine/threonine protein kinase